MTSIPPSTHLEIPHPDRSVSDLNLRTRALWIACGYAIGAGLWIYFSDQTLAFFIHDPAVLVQVSVYKGWGFVGITALLLFFLIRRTFIAIEKGCLELQEHEAQFERLNRLFLVLSQINQEIVRTDSREVLFERICRFLVHLGRFDLAWIGWHDEKSGTLIPVAGTGMDENFPKTIETNPGDASMPTGPALRALQTGETVICHESPPDPLPTEWQKETGPQRFASVGVWPLRVETEVVGVLYVASKATGFFGEREVSLLDEAVMDICFALDNLAKEAHRREVETALRESEQRYRTTLDNILEGCQLIDRNWHYLYVNDAATRHNRRPKEEMLARRVPDVWPGIEKTHVYELFQTGMQTREPVTDEVEFTFPDGATGHYEIRVEPVEEGILVLSIDNTKRKEAERALRLLNENLERQIAARTSELKTALLRAEAADQIKSAFLATMSHELRTPLNSIIGFTGILLQELAGPLNPEQSKQLGMVRESARHLLDLINDVLDISKIEAGQLEVAAAPIDLSALIERVASTVKPLATKKGLDFNIQMDHCPSEIVSDERRLSQILLNLLNNAVKFTETGEITLRVEHSEQFQAGPSVPPQPAVRFTVGDTGIGIKEKDLGLLFEPFRQLDTGLTRQHEGTGLGLAISRRLTDLLGGDISVRSKWQEGSEFTVVIPTRLPN